VTDHLDAEVDQVPGAGDPHDDVCGWYGREQRGQAGGRDGDVDCLAGGDAGGGEHAGPGESIATVVVTANSTSRCWSIGIESD